jgi:hypothetical protein
MTFMVWNDHLENGIGLRVYVERKTRLQPDAAAIAAARITD